MLFKVRDGDLPKPDLVAMSDTMAEKPATMKLLNEVLIPLMKEMDIPFELCTSHLGGLVEYYQSHGAIPIIGTRHCTAKFKIRPIRRKVREYVGNARGKHIATCWLGITTDEDHRESDSDVIWFQNRYPLLELGLSRQDCIDSLARRGIVVEKSGCYMCPYQSGDEWLTIKEDFPDLWQKALDLEDAYYEKHPDRWKGLRYDGKRLREPLTDFAQSKCSSGGCFI